MNENDIRADELGKVLEGIGQLGQQLRQAAAEGLGRAPDGQLNALNAQMALLASVAAGIDQRRGQLAEEAVQ